MLALRPVVKVDQLPLFNEARLCTVKENEPVGTVLQLSVTEFPLLLTLVMWMLVGLRGATGVPRTKLPCGTGSVWLMLLVLR